MWRNKLPWQQKNHLETPNILCLSAYFSKTNSMTPIFLFLESDKQAKTTLSAKCKQILWSGFRVTLKFVNSEGGYESAPENVFKLCKMFYPSVLITLQQ